MRHARGTCSNEGCAAVLHGPAASCLPLLAALRQHACSGHQVGWASRAPTLLPPRRYGGVEAVESDDAASWAFGRRLSVPARKGLLWAHMLAVNGTSIGEGRRLQAPAC